MDPVSTVERRDSCMNLVKFTDKFPLPGSLYPRIGMTSPVLASTPCFKTPPSGNSSNSSPAEPLRDLSQLVQSVSPAVQLTQSSPVANPTPFHSPDNAGSPSPVDRTTVCYPTGNTENPSPAQETTSSNSSPAALLRCEALALPPVTPIVHYR